MSNSIETWFKRGLWMATIFAGLVIVCYFAVMMWSANELSPPESVVASQSTMLAHDGTLYYDLKHYPFTVCAYMPTFYLLESGLIRAGLSAFQGGRLISLLAFLGLIFVCGRLVLLYTENHLAAWVATIAVASSSLLASWGTVGQVDTLAVFLAVSAFYQYSKFHVRGESTLWLAGILAALAVFTKQTMLAAPAAIFLALLFKDWKKALAFAGIFGAGVGGAVFGLNAAMHGRFLDNTIFANMNPFSIDKLLVQLKYFGSISAGLLVIIVASGSKLKRTMAPLIYLGFAAAMFLATAAKIGSDTNYQMEITVVLAVCAAIGLHEIDFFRLYFAQSKSWITLLLLPLGVHVAVGYRVSSNVLLSRIVTEKVFRAEIQELRPYVNPAGMLLSTDFNAMTRLRGRMDVEPLIYNLLVNAGRIDPGPVQADIERGAFGTVLLGQDLAKPQIEDLEIGTLPTKQLDEIRKRYKMVKHIDGPFLDGVYVYKPIATEVAAK